MKIVGAILSPYDADPSQAYPLVLRSMEVTWDPVYLKVLHKQAPLTTHVWEVLP